MVEEFKQAGGKAWATLVAVCCFYAGGMALTSSIAGVYMLPVSEAIGVSRAEFTIYLTVQGAASMVLLPVVGNLFNRVKNFRLFMSFGSILLALGIFTMAFCTQVWQFCLCTIPIAFGMCCIYSVGGPTLITNWFAPKHRGKMLGIASAFSGVGTFVWAPMFTMILQSMGWQFSYMINGILALVLTLPFCAFVIKRTPEENGMLPYGASAEKGDVAIEAGMSAGAALKTVAIYLVELCCLACCLGMGFNSSLPAMCIETFVPAGITDAAGAALLGSTLISIAAVGNIIGKIVYGWMADKFGSRIPIVIFAIFTFAAFLLWAMTNSVPLYYVAAFLFGTHNALMSVAFPLLIRQLYGNRDFSKIWSYVSMPFTFLGTAATTIVSAMYMAMGETYHPVFIIGAVGIACVGVLAIVATSFIGKYKWTYGDQKPAAAASDGGEE